MSKARNRVVVVFLICMLLLIGYKSVRFFASIPHLIDGNNDSSKRLITMDFYYDKSDSSILLYDRKNQFFQYFIKNGVDSFFLQKGTIVVSRKGVQMKVDTLHKKIMP